MYLEKSNTVCDSVMSYTTGGKMKEDKLKEALLEVAKRELERYQEELKEEPEHEFSEGFERKMDELIGRA